MKKILTTFLLINALFLLSACALVPESVELNPQINSIPSANIGHGKKVALQVIDARPSNAVGGRPSGYGPAASITLANNIQRVVYDAVTRGLKKYNFEPVPYSTDVATKLTLRIIALNYSQSVGLLTAGINIDSAIEGRAENQGKSYDRVYRGNRNNRVIFTPTSSMDTQNINLALSQTLNEIVQDKNLMYFLAK